MTDTLHIIEPTLSGQAGHCQSFVASLCSAGASRSRFTVWGGRQASLPGAAAGVRLCRYFSRRLRRLQELFLLRRLLREEGRIFIATAGRVDLVLLNLAASGAIPPGKVYLFFHWMRPSPKKLAFFRRIAEKHPELVIMGPTPSVVDVFTDCGFKNCRVVPYPITPRVGELPEPPFRHLLFAGAARSDKGFSHVVGLLAHLALKGSELPFALQTSADHYDKYDEETRRALERLATIGYHRLAVTGETLSTEDYFGMFSGAVCLQPYDATSFADRISGITLDALSMGAPVVTLAGTWMARVVERFDAGAVVPHPTPELLFEAVQRVVRDYPRFQANAARAGQAIQEEYSAGHLYALLTA